MFARLKRTAGSFALVLLVFGAYRVTAVPLIEPKFVAIEGPISTPEEIAIQKKRQQERLEQYKKYFPPGSWEREGNPTVLENDRSKLLFNEYHNQDDGHVKLFPCAILFMPDGEAAEGAAPGRVIVLEAPQGALLQFDSPVDLQQGKIGKLLGGQMDGPITIHGTASRPGANDELDVVTRDLVLTTEHITTSAPVDFQMGPNHGHGRAMQIDLLPSPGASAHGPSVGGVQALSLLHEVQMRLVPGSGGLLPLDPGNRGAKPPEKPQPLAAAPAPATNAAAGSSHNAPAAPPIPIDIHCRGPFHFDLTLHTATFEDQVDVLRAAHDGPSDQMTCERLSVQFAPKAAPAVSPSTASVASITQAKPINDSSAGPGGNSPHSSSSMEPQRIIARGNPVIVRAPSNGVFLRGEHLDYTTTTRRLAIDAQDEATVQEGANEIHAPSVVYQPGDDGGLGFLDAVGPGWLRGIPPQSAGPIPGVASDTSPTRQRGSDGPPPLDPRHPPTPPQLFEAHWTTELKMRPHDQEHLISLIGNARAGFSGQGEISAGEIHLWLKEVPVTPTSVRVTNSGSEAALDKAANSAPKNQVQPDRMLALGNVRINSPQLVGTTSRLEAWFEQAPPAAARAAPAAAKLPGAVGPGTSPAGAGPSNALASESVNPVAAPGSPPPDGWLPGTAAPPRKPPAPLQRYVVEGDRIRVQLLARGSVNEVQDITIDGQVHFAESLVLNPGDQPLVVAGNQLEVLRANAPDTNITVRGRPAQTAARGLELYGDTIRLDKAANRLWIDGPGRMKLAGNRAQTNIARVSATPPAGGAAVAVQPPAEPVDITWEGRMLFDGTTAHFERAIVAQTATRTMWTESLDATLRKPIDFSQPKMQERAEIGRILCHSEVRMESRTFDGPQLASIDRMQLRDLMVDEVTGAVLGNGPGWLTSVRHGSADPTATPAGGLAAQPVVPPLPHRPVTRSANFGTDAGPLAPPTDAAAPSESVVVEPTITQSGVQPAGGRRPAAAHGAPPDKDQLNYLNVQFTGALSGNLNQREFTFHDQVHTIYGPVRGWDDQLNPNNADALGPGGVLMNCDQLTVRETNARASETPPPTSPQTAPSRRPLEMEAIGNTLVEGQTFTARANRLTYAEIKDLLVLEGDGRNDAQLFRQEYPGGPQSKTEARKILYWRTTDRVQISDARILDFEQFGGKDAAPGTPKQPSKSSKLK